MKIIFLDFDGVLNCQQYLLDIYNKTGKAVGTTMLESVIDSKAVEILNEIIRQTGAKVCVSSTWRKDHTIQRLQEILNKNGFIGEVVGKTGSCATGHRGTEIKEWLDDEGSCKEYKTNSFVIIDDDSDMSPYKNKLVKTDNQTGLLQEHIKMCVDILNNIDFKT